MSASEIAVKHLDHQCMLISKLSDTNNLQLSYFTAQQTAQRLFHFFRFSEVNNRLSNLNCGQDGRRKSCLL